MGRKVYEYGKEARNCLKTGNVSQAKQRPNPYGELRYR